jgi:hypothetical protein
MLGNGQPRRFRVRVPTTVRESIREDIRQIPDESRRNRCISALHVINERLRSDALTFGEPVYTLKNANLLVRKGVVAPVAVDYAVHEPTKTVFVRSLKLLS